MKVRLPGLHGTISVNFVFILMALTQFSLGETLTIALGATLVQCLWRPKTRPKLIQVLFNTFDRTDQHSASLRAAHAVPGQLHLLIALAPAATVFFVMNTGMISLVLALLSKTTLLAVWKQCHLWAFPLLSAGSIDRRRDCAISQTVGWRLFTGGFTGDVPDLLLLQDVRLITRIRNANVLRQAMKKPFSVVSLLALGCDARRAGPLSGAHRPRVIVRESRAHRGASLTGR